MNSLRHITLLVFLGIALSPLRAAELDEQLALLIPGTSIQESSGRHYAQQQLESLFARLEAQRIRRKRPAKMLARIQEEVTRTFFQEYLPQADFHALIKQGQFNQNTATALYALVLSYFQIPYHLQVQAADLVLLPLPSENDSPLAIPQVRPLSETAAEHFRTAYVDLLRATNFPPDTDTRQLSTTELYQRYYLQEGQPLQLREAAAFLYYQQALLAYQDKAWSRCQDMLGRAKQLSPHAMCEVLERAIWLQLASQDANSQESTFYLWKLWEAQPGQPWQDELLKRFDAQVRQLPAASKAQIDSIYTTFRQGFGTQPEAQARLREHYFVLSARYEAEAGHTVAVLNLMDSLYLLRPAETDIQDILAQMMVWSLHKERRFEEGLKRIAYYQQHYPFVVHNQVFQDQHLFYQAERVHHYFQADDEQAGLNYLQEFENLLRRTGETPRYDAWVTTAYLAASNYYFRQERYPPARVYIERALDHAPADDYLLHRRDLLARY